MILVPCPECGVENMLQVRLKPRSPVCSRDPQGASITAAPDVVVSCCGEVLRLPHRVPRLHQAA